MYIKNISISLIFFLFISGIHAQQTENLNTVVKRSARGIEDTLPQGTMVAVINFASPSEAFSDYIVDELSGELVTGRKVTIVDRRSLTHIREEMNFQLSGDVSDESAQAIGKLLGAQFIVSGTLTNMGSFFRFRIRVINVETAVLQNQISLNLQNDSQVTFLLYGNQTSTTAPSTASTAPAATTQTVQPAPVAQPTPVPATQPAPQPVTAPAASTGQTYKIGDKGPAGGIVFYDKGNYSDGWRYMEASPVDLGNVEWGLNKVDITGTKTDIGEGKRNTELIIAELNKRGETGKAAQLCREYTLNGYSDWFLPSRDELNEIYKQKRHLGKYYHMYYWSSSQGTNDKAWGQYFTENFRYHMEKNRKDLRVRAVRAF